MYGMAMRLEDREVQDFLRETRGALGDRNVRAVVGRAGTNKLRSHLVDYDRSHANALGGKRTHFYAQAARSTHYEDVAGGVILVISHVGIGLRYFGTDALPGGKLRPVNARLLAIPATRKAHGRRPREFDNLQLVMFGSTGIGALMERAHSEISFSSTGRIRRGRTVRGKRRKIYYWLVPEVEQKGDPDVLPSESALMDAIVPPAHQYVRAIREGNARRANR